MQQVVPSMVVSTTETWQAQHRITSDGRFSVGLGGDVTLEAGKRVTLRDGFSMS